MLNQGIAVACFFKPGDKLDGKNTFLGYHGSPRSFDDVIVATPEKTPGNDDCSG